MNDKLADERRPRWKPSEMLHRQPVADCSSRPLFFLCRGHARVDKRDDHACANPRSDWMALRRKTRSQCKHRLPHDQSVAGQARPHQYAPVANRPRNNSSNSEIPCRASAPASPEQPGHGRKVPAFRFTWTCGRFTCGSTPQNTTCSDVHADLGSYVPNRVSRQPTLFEVYAREESGTQSALQYEPTVHPAE